jgi:hypothetical protein
MGRAHLIIHDDLLRRVEIDQQVLIVSARPFGEDAHLLLVSSDRLPAGYHGRHGLFVDDGGQIQFKRDVDV